MDLNLSVFQEPRGIMRIFHFIFAIVSFATTVDFTGHVKITCKQGTTSTESIIHYFYPFNLQISEQVNGTANCTINVFGDFSSDAMFYVCTGVLAMLYSIGIIILYTKFDQLYKKNENVPLIDFALSVFLTILWLSSSAAWANGLTGLKSATSTLEIIPKDCATLNCSISTGSFSTLTISIIVGFLNFFLWASNLWFLYKETKFFAKPQNPEI